MQIKEIRRGNNVMALDNKKRERDVEVELELDITVKDFFVKSKFVKPLEVALEIWLLNIVGCKRVNGDIVVEGRKNHFIAGEYADVHDHDPGLDLGHDHDRDLDYLPFFLLGDQVARRSVAAIRLEDSHLGLLDRSRLELRARCECICGWR